MHGTPRSLTAHTLRFAEPSTLRVLWLALAALAATFAVGCGAITDRDSGTSSMPGQAADGGMTAIAPSNDMAPEELAKSGATNRSSAPSSGAAQAPGGSSSGAGGGMPALPSLEAGRNIVRTGTAELEVKSVQDAFEQVRGIATARGGFVADSSFTGGDERQIATLTIRVPADRFAEVVTELRGVAVDVRSITSTSRDVTGEYTDLEATLRNLRAVETQYTQLLGRAGSIGDVLQVQDRLNQVRLQIDRTEARRQVLQALTEMSTLTVTLRPEAASIGGGSGPLGAAARAWAASLVALESVATAAIVVLVFSWWLLPLLVIAALLARRYWRRRPPAAPPAAA